MKKILIAALDDNADNYIAACQSMGLDPLATADLSRACEFDALLLPGGGDINPSLYGQENRGSTDIIDEKDAFQTAAIEKFLALGKPILGTCRGLQLLNVYFGGSLIQDISGHRIENEGTHKVYIDKDCPYFDIISAGTGGIYVNSTHHQCADRIGEGLSRFALSEDGITEGLYSIEKHILAVQWHPERMMEKGGKIIYKIFSDMIV